MVGRSVLREAGNICDNCGPNIGITWLFCRKGFMCLELKGYRDRQGYGSISFGGRIWRAHRLVYALTNLDFDPKLLVCHHCDNPSCINPNHLFQSDQAGNMVDKARKNRGRKSFSGLPYGVSLVPSTGRFHSGITSGGHNYSLGTYSTAEEATRIARAFKQKELEKLCSNS